MAQRIAVARARLRLPALPALLLLAGLLLAACTPLGAPATEEAVAVATLPPAVVEGGATAAAPEATAPEPAATSEPVAAPATPVATPAEGAATATLDEGTQEVRAMFLASLGYDPAQRTPNEPGIEGVVVFELQPPPGGPRVWAAHTVGLRNFSTNQPHQLALYQQGSDGAIVEVARTLLNHELDATPAAGVATFEPDYIGEGGVRQLAVEPAGLWLGVEAGVGAHSGAFALYRFQDGALEQQMSAFNSSPGIAATADVDGDGTLEILIDAGEAYVFCYACGVRIPQVALWRWDGEAMALVEPARLPADAPAEYVALNDTLLAQAQAGLWGDVRTTLEALDAAIAQRTNAGVPLPEALKWNVALARLNEEAKRARLSAPEPPYLLLDHIFYGDYAGAVDLFRPYPPATIFAPGSPLIAGTVAEGWEESLAGWAALSSGAALSANPDLAPAHFVAAWAAWLAGDRTGALAAMERAAALAPDDSLYAAAVETLRGQAAAGGSFVAPAALALYAGPGEEWPALGTVQAGAAATATGRLQDGSWVQLLYRDSAGEGAGEGAPLQGWVRAVDESGAPLPVPALDALPVTPAPPLVAPVVQRGRIFYSQVNGEGVSAIWSVDVVAGAQPLLVVEEARQPALQPQGELLAFASTRPDMLGLGGVDLRTGQRLRFSFNVEDMLPRWSAEGDRLLFSSTREGDRKPRIYRVWNDGAGSAETVLLGQDADLRPGDGLLVYKGCDDAGAGCGLWTSAADGSSRAPLTANPGDARPRWAPDGSSIVFMSDQRDGNWELYLLSMADLSVRRLTDHSGPDGLPAFSPDGASVAWVSQRADSWQILTLRLGAPLSSAGVPEQPLPIVNLGADLPDWLEQGLDWAR